MENVYKRVVKLRNILFGISIVAVMVMCFIAMFHILNGKVLRCCFYLLIKRFNSLAFFLLSSTIIFN